MSSKAQTERKPFVFADVPDLAMIRAGDICYVTGTTKHMGPGMPLRKSKGPVNWQLVSICGLIK
jgi:beta-xylosidase